MCSNDWYPIILYNPPPHKIPGEKMLKFNLSFVAKPLYEFCCGNLIWQENCLRLRFHSYFIHDVGKLTQHRATEFIVILFRNIKVRLQKYGPGSRRASLIIFRISPSCDFFLEPILPQPVKTPLPVSLSWPKTLIETGKKFQLHLFTCTSSTSSMSQFHRALFEIQTYIRVTHSLLHQNITF